MYARNAHCICGLNVLVLWQTVSQFPAHMQQRYMIKDSEEQVQLVEPDTAAPLADYTSTQGLRDAAVPGLTERFGLNKFDIPVPEFSELYLQQVAR